MFMAGTVPPDVGISPSPASDRDRDGVPDVSDNCPDTANPDQTANEDGDRFGDVCDPCPQIADNALVDSDSDRVGDVCDPNPGTRDSVWLFEGFHQGLPAWARSTNWTAVGDKLRVAAAGNTPNDSEYLTLPLANSSAAWDNFTVTTSVLVEQRTGTTNIHEVGISLYDAVALKGLDCELDQDPGSSGILLLRGDGNLNKSQSFAWVNNTEYRLTVGRRGSTYTCSVASSAGTQTISGTSTAVVPKAADVWAYGATAQVGSVFVVGTP